MENLTDKEYEQIMDVFASPGWRLIIRDIEETYDSLDSVLNIQSNDEFQQVKGGLYQLGLFINLKDWYQNAKDNQDAEV